MRLGCGHSRGRAGLRRGLAPMSWGMRVTAVAPGNPSRTRPAILSRYVAGRGSCAEGIAWTDLKGDGDMDLTGVEVARNLPGAVAVRDSKDPDGPKLTFTPDEWVAFTAGIKTGEFDLA
jgi:hypothetical protein